MSSIYFLVACSLGSLGCSYHSMSNAAAQGPLAVHQPFSPYSIQSSQNYFVLFPFVSCIGFLLEFALVLTFSSLFAGRAAPSTLLSLKADWQSFPLGY